MSVFVNVRNDEGEHMKTMEFCQRPGNGLRSPSSKEAMVIFSDENCDPEEGRANKSWSPKKIWANVRVKVSWTASSISAPDPSPRTIHRNDQTAATLLPARNTFNTVTKPARAIKL